MHAHARRLPVDMTFACVYLGCWCLCQNVEKGFVCVSQIGP